MDIQKLEMFHMSYQRHMVVAWRSGYSALALINEVNQRRARLVLTWVTVSGFNFR